MIEKGVQLPPEALRSPGGYGKYPWRECVDEGDSFLTESPLKSVEFAARKFCQRNKDFRFYVAEVEPGKVRVWRIK